MDHVLAEIRMRLAPAVHRQLHHVTHVRRHGDIVHFRNLLAQIGQHFAFDRQQGDVVVIERRHHFHGGVPDRIAAARQAFHAHDREHLYPIVVTDGIGVPADRLELVGEHFAFEHPLGRCRYFEIDGLTAHHFHRLATQAASKRRLVNVERHTRRRSEMQRRFADAGNRDLEPLAHLRRLEGVTADVGKRRVPPIKRGQVRLRARRGIAAALRMGGLEELREAIPAGVATTGLGILAEGHGVGDVCRAFLAEPHVRQLRVERDVVPLDDDFFTGGVGLVDDFRRVPARRVGQHLRVVQLGLAPVAKADGHGRAFTGAERIEEDGYVFGIDGIDVVEQQRRTVLRTDVVHQGLQLVGVAPAVERHVDMLELPFLFEQREELAHVLERHETPRKVSSNERLTCRRLPAAPPADQTRPVIGRRLTLDRTGHAAACSPDCGRGIIPAIGSSAHPSHFGHRMAAARSTP